MSRLIALTGAFDPLFKEELRLLLLERISEIEISEHPRWRKFETRPDLVLVGGFDDAGAALSRIRSVRQDFAGVPLILITSRGSENLAAACLRLAIQDYFSLPLEWEELLDSVKRQIPFRAPESSRLIEAGRFIGESDAVASVLRSVERIAPASSNVLITGETGTGKEVVASLIHKNSPRAQGPFIGINCAAIPENLLESELFGYERGAFTGAVARQPGKLRVASGGTVFLDEVGDLSVNSQAKLLRAIETRQIVPLGSHVAVAVDVRFVAATNQELEILVDEKRFRRDLFFRLNVGRIRLAPLRERREDIPALARQFVREFNEAFGRNVFGFTSPAMECLMRHGWPGNVRELRNVVESAFLSSSAPWLDAADLPESLGGLQPGAGPASERARLVAALADTGWNKSEAARRLRWSRMTIYRKMLKYGLIDEAGETVTGESGV